MKTKLKHTIVFFALIILTLGIRAQISGPLEVYAGAEAEYSHNYTPSPGTHFIWEVINGTMESGFNNPNFVWWISNPGTLKLWERDDQTQQIISLVDQITVQVYPLTYELKYSYDAAGNRIKREYGLVALLKSAMVNDTINGNSENHDPKLAGLSDSHIKLYPNPTKGEIFILIEKELKENLDIQIYDLKGNLLENRRYDNSTIKIDLTDQPAGVYILKIKADNGIKEWKIMKK